MPLPTTSPPPPHLLPPDNIFPLQSESFTQCKGGKLSGKAASFLPNLSGKTNFLHAKMTYQSTSKAAKSTFRADVLLTFHLIHFAGGQADGDDVIVVCRGEHKQVTMSTGREESHVADAGWHCHLVGCLQGTWQTAQAVNNHTQVSTDIKLLKSKVFKYAKWPSKWLTNESLVSDLMK